jgi:hypothetical protein
VKLQSGDSIEQALHATDIVGIYKTNNVSGVPKSLTQPITNLTFFVCNRCKIDIDVMDKERSGSIHHFDDAFDHM